ncbi:endonuclease domain-containing protein [Mesorhizobium sp. YR577]|uniref:endonuclease domain-containing protein n=1 Tax=Mesorhizobium sp. YR577 TaxID=1884373 RepID=UPI0008ED1A84|nr:endonuclease domain-containing protein [Mesorhizobium sp. YR577]SFU07074.1 Very-short-patch-repair endonuclease [Mesorhizobium sp. YR577]
MPRTKVPHEMRQKARALRHLATKAETLLWYELRDLKLVGLKFRRQSPIGPYIVDFVCLAAKLVVEVDGDFHETENGKRHDANRDAYLRSLGFEVLRVDEPEVIANAWHIAQVVKEKAELVLGDPTRPLRGHPPLKGEGDAGARGERF